MRMFRWCRLQDKEFGNIGWVDVYTPRLSIEMPTLFEKDKEVSHSFKLCDDYLLQIHNCYC